MSEQQKDFKNIVFAFKSNKYTPEQLGKFFRQYYVKHLQTPEIPQEDHSMFDGKLPLTY